MKKYLLLLIFPLSVFAQSLPHVMSETEKNRMGDYLRSYPQQRLSGITVPPSSPVRASAEWEEIDALIIAWTSYQSILKEIVRYAQMEVPVIIVCSDSNTVITYLTNNGVTPTNVQYLIAPFNSIWCRDYGPWN